MSDHRSSFPPADDPVNAAPSMRASPRALETSASLSRSRSSGLNTAALWRRGAGCGGRATSPRGSSATRGRRSRARVPCRRSGERLVREYQLDAVEVKEALERLTSAFSRLRVDAAARRVDGRPSVAVAAAGRQVAHAVEQRCRRTRRHPRERLVPHVRVWPGRRDLLEGLETGAQLL